MTVFQLRRKLPAVILALLLLMACAACDDREDDVPAMERGTAAIEAPPAAEDAPDSEQGLSMSVDRATGRLDISRPVRSEEWSADEAGTWTIFVYLCGTDLESEYGMASGDLMEMLDAAGSDDICFVVETGGAYEWYDDGVDGNRRQRFLIRNGEMYLVDEGADLNMGQSGALADFLQWGLAEWPAERMGLVLWDHGGGSVAGVCFDERYDYDSLSLREIDDALLQACGGMTFEFIGFDACLMGTLETANILASYARYMYGSEETEPGSGWDYTEIGDYLAAHPGADGAELGRVVCDSYLAACRAEDDDDLATLSVVDLSRLDTLLVSFNAFAESMYGAGSDSEALASMIRGIERADNFGGNNKSEGYTNMVDLGGLLSACADWTEGADAALAALRDAVIYSVSGATHRGVSGLSLYYPLSVQGSQELSVFSDICTSPYYLAFVDEHNRSSVNGGEYNGGWLDEWFYDWFGDDDIWYWPPEPGAEDGYWDYLDGYEQTGESPLITFEIEPVLDEDGDYWFVLDDEGYDFAADVYGYVYELSPDGEDLIELGETYDIIADWETGFFCDDFDGWWLSLPDGQNLALYIVETAADHIIYTSPVFLNGEETNLRLRQGYDGSVVIEGAWDGIDEYGAAAREIVKLQSGDSIVPIYYSYSLDDLEEAYYYGAEYTVRGTPEVTYDVMESGDYLFAFCIDDIFGDYYLTDFVMFYVDEYGDIYFYED